MRQEYKICNNISTVATKRLACSELFDRYILGVELHQAVEHVKYALTDTRLLRNVNARMRNLC